MQADARARARIVNGFDAHRGDRYRGSSRTAHFTGARHGAVLREKARRLGEPVRAVEPVDRSAVGLDARWNPRVRPRAFSRLSTGWTRIRSFLAPGDGLLTSVSLQAIRL